MGCAPRFGGIKRMPGPFQHEQLSMRSPGGQTFRMVRSNGSIILTMRDERPSCETTYGLLNVQGIRMRLEVSIEAPVMVHPLAGPVVDHFESARFPPCFQVGALGESLGEIRHGRPGDQRVHTPFTVCFQQSVCRFSGEAGDAASPAVSDYGKWSMCGDAVR